MVVDNNIESNQNKFDGKFWHEVVKYASFGDTLKLLNENSVNETDKPEEVKPKEENSREENNEDRRQKMEEELAKVDKQKEEALKFFETEISASLGNLSKDILQNNIA